MNPFMMMFSPLGGFGFFGGGCCCGVNMPYYGMDDRLTFMNFPVFRNTSMDYLLDPRLAMMQSQQSMMYGGGNIFGNTMLPMFNNFPGMNFPGMNTSWTPWWQPTRTETEEEKKKREAEEKDPKNVKAKEKIDNYIEVYEKLKASASGSDEFKDFEKEYKEALKEKKITDRLEKLEKLFEAVETKALAKAALADKDIDHKLYMIGYNFPSSTSNKHKINSSKNEIDWKSFLTDMEANLSKDNATPVGILGGKMVDASHPENKGHILQIISTWNDTHKDENSKGLLRKLADYIPTSDEQVVNWKAGISGLTSALISKTDSFIEDNGETSDFSKLVAQRKKVSDLLDKKITNNKNVQKSDVLALANEFDKLYAMLRIQEAIVMNREVIDKFAEKFNAIDEDAIPEDIIIKETIQDLKNENIAVPSDKDLDKIPEKESSFRVSRTPKTSELEELDEAADGNGEKLAQLLVENQKLKAVQGHEGIYETKNDDRNAPKKYYGITKDNKLVEVIYDDETKKYVADGNAKDASAVDIGTYLSTVKEIDRYIKAATITKIAKIDGAYQSIDKDLDGHFDQFVIKDNKLVKINGKVLQDGTIKLNNGKIKTVQELTTGDYTVVESSADIYTKLESTDTSETTTTTTETQKDKVQKTKINTESDAYKDGSAVAEYVDGITDEVYYSEINDILKARNRDNVFDFLAGFYSRNFRDGIIEYLDDEYDGKVITIDGKKNLIKSFIEFAKSKGISESDSRIKVIELILKKYENAKYAEDNEFKHGNFFNFSRGAWNGFCSIFALGDSDNEVIDDKLKSLFNELKKN